MTKFIKNKIFRKFLKIFLFITVSILFLSTLASIAIQNSKIQTWFVERITRQLSESLGTKIALGKVDIDFFNKLVISNLTVFDQKNDTLFHTNNLYASIVFFKPKKQKIFFHKITIDHSTFNIYRDNDSIFNFQFLLDAIQKSDTVKKSWKIDCSNFDILNSKISYKFNDYAVVKSRINFKDVELYNFNAKFHDFDINKESTSLKIKELSFNEKSGFQFKNMIADLTIKPGSLSFKNLRIVTSRSNINAKTLKFNYNNIKDFKKFSYNVKFESDFNETLLHTIDLSYFTPALYNANQKIIIAGSFSGKFSKLKMKNTTIKYGENTVFNGNISISGLPDFDKSYYFIDVKNLISNKSDIELIPIPPFNNVKYIQLPENFNQFGLINYKGKITGFLKDFVVYGNLDTDIGNIYTDININRSDKSGQILLSGEIGSRDFEIGNYLGINSFLGRLNGFTRIEGFIEPDKQMELSLNGKIRAIEAKNYNYQNIDFQGVLYKNKFDGSIVISDPNLNLDFFGHIDFSKEIPVFDFTADISKAHLDELGIDNSNSLSDLSFSLVANFNGATVDNIYGRVDVYNTTYKNQRNNFKMKKLSIYANLLENEKELVINSDFLEAKLFGQYNFIALITIIKSLGNLFLPAITNKEIIRDERYINNFNFKINILDLDPLTKTFYPDISLEKNTKFGGFYNSEERSFEVVCHSDQVIFKNKKLLDLEMKSQIYNEQLDIKLDAKSFFFSGSNYIDNFKLETRVYHDTIDLYVSWENDDTIKYSGNFEASCYFSRLNSSDNLNTTIIIHPSEIVLSDSLWLVNKTIINIDSSSLTLQDLFISHGNQYLKLNGTISKLPDDTLFAEYQNIDLSLFNIFAKQKGFEIGGILNGNSNFTSFYTDKLFTSDLTIDNSEINKELLGKMNVKSSWDKKNRQLLINASAKRDEIKTISLNGSYMPSNKSLNFDLFLNKLRLNIIQPYVAGVATNLKGISSGKLKLSGKLKEPILEGDIKVQKASFAIDYLKTKYNFSDVISLKNNKIEFDNLKLYDAEGNLAYVNGSVNHKYFKNFSFDISIEAENYLMLNTNEEDNYLYFGTAYATGLIRLSGNTNNVIMDISAKTDRNTVFYIPLTSSEIAEQKDYITFVSENIYVMEEKEEYFVDLSGLELNFDLEVTPDAEVQIIFDSKVGDVMRGRGNAELNMKISATGDFTMYGDYIIEEGDYLFTLQNVINKKFDVKQGGIISWNGDPYNATLDLNAIYSIKKTSVLELIPDSTSRYPVDCQLLMTGNLMNPDIEFNIDIPPPSDSEKEKINSIIASFPEDEMNKQLLSLLVLNRFQPYYVENTSAIAPAIIDINDAKRSATELLSNQLSHWFSQISDDVDLGFNYQPGDKLSSDQYEIALSTQLLNNRLTIDTNVGIGGQNPGETSQNQGTYNVVGDFTLRLKLNKSGKLRMAVYNKANDNYYEYETAPYTQGIGFFYKEEFNKFSDLFNRKKK